MHTVEYLRSRGYAPLQIEAYMAKMERESRRQFREPKPRLRVRRALPPPPVEEEPVEEPEVQGPRLPRRIFIHTVQRLICAEYAIRREQIIGVTRVHDVVFPRQLAMYLALRVCNASLLKVGAAFNKDHTSVIHARDKIAKMRECDQKFDTWVSILEDACGYAS